MNHFEDNNKQETPENRSPIKTMFDKFANHKDVTLIYGEPILHEKQCIVPVAKMKYSFGAGGGKGTNTNKGKTTLEQGEGEGGGGMISVKPIGVYEMTTSHVRFKPVIDISFIGTIITVLTLGFILLLRKK